MSNKTSNISNLVTTGTGGKDSTQKPFREGNAMDRFVDVFEASARRWELVMYPAMIAFGVLAAYGFFLIYTLSKDINRMAQGMDPELGKNLSHISESVIYLSENMRTMTRRVYHMSESVESMAGRMEALEYLEPMLNNMQGMNLSMDGMNQNMRTMNLNIDAMRYNMGDMSHSLRPMGNLDDIMP
jgi:methyl-accepting chemotaxis protein